jgi:hypothetical protein
VKVIGAHGQKIRRRRTNVRRKRKSNPKTTRVARCVRKVVRANAARRRAGKKTVRSPVAVCQTSTGQSYATGRRIARSKRASKALRANPLPIRVAFKDGPPVALFRSLPRARQYAQALADHSGRQVRVQG